MEGEESGGGRGGVRVDGGRSEAKRFSCLQALMVTGDVMYLDLLHCVDFGADVESNLGYAPVRVHHCGIIVSSLCPCNSPMPPFVFLLPSETSAVNNVIIGSR